MIIDVLLKSTFFPSFFGSKMEKVDLSPQIPCFDFRWCMSLASKTRIITYVQWIPYIHLWCDTCCPLDGKHFSCMSLFDPLTFLHINRLSYCASATLFLSYYTQIGFLKQLYVLNRIIPPFRTNEIMKKYLSGWAATTKRRFRLFRVTEKVLRLLSIFAILEIIFSEPTCSLTLQSWFFQRQSFEH